MENKRPTIITALCVCFAIGAIFSIPVIFSDTTRHIRDWFPYALALFAIMGLISMIGLWRMKKWAVVLYITSFLVGQFLFYVTGIEGNAASYYMPLTVIIILLTQYSKMQ